MNIFTGGCLCGQLRLTARGQPYRVGLCHCMDCRKHHGALFHASAIFPESAVTITGEAHATMGAPSPHLGCARYFPQRMRSRSTLAH